MKRNTIVKINTQFWGRYIGKLIETKTGFRGYAKAVVEILKVTEQPKQCAILFPEFTFKREAYKVGQIIEFDLSEVSECK